MSEPTLVAVGNGTTGPFDLTFPYLRREHVHATVGGVSVALNWVNATRVTLAVAAPTGSSVVIRRVTPIAPLHELQNNRPVPAANYTELVIQALYYAEERPVATETTAAAAAYAASATASAANARASELTAADYAAMVLNPALFMQKSENLSGLANVSTARVNLGITTAGTALITAAGASAQRTALGLGGLAIKNLLDFAEVNPTSVITAAKTIAANVNDTTLVTPAAVKAYADVAGVGTAQTWQNVSGSRTLGTTYQNTTGKPITIKSYSTHQTTYSFTVEVSTDGTTWTNVFTRPSTAFIAGTGLFESLMVPPGHYYRSTITSGTAPTFTWMELR